METENAEKSRYYPILFPDDLLERIDDYRYANRIPSRAEAVRTLVETGLEVLDKKPAASAKAAPARKRKSGD